MKVLVKHVACHMKPVVLLCLDGCSWDYIQSATMPNLAELRRTYTSVTCKAMVPTVTNVNNASILTGEFPIKHGITGNYYLDRFSSVETYMDSSAFLKWDTLLARASKKGLKTLLLTVKDKLRRLLTKDLKDSFSLEKPSDWAIREIGEPPNIYSPEASIWLLDVAIEALRRGFDLVYASTTDYIPHKYAPESAEAKEYMREIDEKIGLFLEEDATLGITADHGMNRKTIKIDFEKVLSKRNIKVKVLPIIKDEYVEHHQNLGGAVYLYLEKRNDMAKALDVLLSLSGVEAALTKKQASRQVKLPMDRIGDILVLGSKEAVFGPVAKGEIEDIELRSHGSLHERAVPLMINKKVEVTGSIFNKDAFKLLLAENHLPH
jgi:phosphonoacetate hydrolase